MWKECRKTVKTVCWLYPSLTLEATIPASANDFFFFHDFVNKSLILHKKPLPAVESHAHSCSVKKTANIRKRCNQVPRMTQDDTWDSNHHQQETRGQPFPSRWPQGSNEQTRMHQKHKIPNKHKWSKPQTKMPSVDNYPPTHDDTVHQRSTATPTCINSVLLWCKCVWLIQLC